MAAATFGRGCRLLRACCNCGGRLRDGPPHAMPTDRETRWSIYLLRCGDGTLYTGIATDVQRRLTEHESGRCGAKYLKGRGPLRLEMSKRIGDRSLASRLENRVKRLTRAKKESLIEAPRELDDLLSDLRRSRDQ